MVALNLIWFRTHEVDFFAYWTKWTFDEQSETWEDASLEQTKEESASQQATISFDNTLKCSYNTP